MPARRGSAPQPHFVGRIAARRARAAGMAVWALTGRGPNPLAELADEAICVPSDSTAIIQEVHLVLLHALCTVLDEGFAPCEAEADTPDTSDMPATPGKAIP